MRAANLRVADRPARGWPPIGRIIMNPYCSPNYNPFGICLIMATAITQVVVAVVVVHINESARWMS
jgi:uncharacterized membrane protein